MATRENVTIEYHFPPPGHGAVAARIQRYSETIEIKIVGSQDDWSVETGDVSDERHATTFAAALRAAHRSAWTEVELMDEAAEDAAGL